MNTRADISRQESMRWEPTVQPPPLFWTPGEEMFTIQQLVDLGYGPDSTIQVDSDAAAASGIRQRA